MCIVMSVAEVRIQSEIQGAFFHEADRQYMFDPPGHIFNIHI